MVNSLYHCRLCALSVAITYSFTLLLTHRNLWSIYIEHIMSSLRSLCLSIGKSRSISYKTRNGETLRSLRRKTPSLAPARSLYSCPGQVTKVCQKILFTTRAGTLAADKHVIAKLPWVPFDRFDSWRCLHESEIQLVLQRQKFSKS